MKRTSSWHFGMLAICMLVVGFARCGEPSVEKREEDKKTANRPIAYVVVSFAGLGDSGACPTDWSGRIKSMIERGATGSLGKPQVYTLSITGSVENKTITEHAQEANNDLCNYIRTLGVPAPTKVKLILVAESYGGLVAAELALMRGVATYQFDIAGLVTIRTPWEGVSFVDLISLIKPFLPMLEKRNMITIDTASMIHFFADCDKPLATLNPSSSFIRNFEKKGLKNLKFPILVLAGKDTVVPTSPYKELLEASTDASLPFHSLLKIPLRPYRSGNDGLVTVASATAANSNKPAEFEMQVINEGFSHLEGRIDHQEALEHVERFIKTITKQSA